MKYITCPSVSIASHGDLLVIQESSGELYDIWPEKDVHLALLQILIAGADSSGDVYDEVRGSLTEILEQLSEAGLIRPMPEEAALSYFQLSNINQTIGCLGAKSRDAAAQLGAVKTSSSSTVRVYFTDSTALIQSSLKNLNAKENHIICEFSSNELIVSPFLNESDLTINDWLIRRTAASWWPVQMRVRLECSMARAVIEDPLSDAQAEMLLQVINKKLSAKDQANLETRIDVHGNLTDSFVLPVPKLKTPLMPGKDSKTSKSSLSLEEQQKRMVSRYTGIVRGLDYLSTQSWWPEGLHIVESKIADVESVLGWPADRIAAGASWDTPDLAVASALGEAVERYSGNAIPETGYETATYSELQRRDINAINPETFALFSEEQYRAEGFPFVRFSKDKVTEWVWGRSLLSNKACMAPAQLSYVNWYHSKDNSEPTNVTMFAGIAAGPSIEFAEASALEEIIERDAVHIWWHARLPLKALKFPPHSSIAKRMNSLGPEWRHSIFSIPSPTGVPVMGCLLLHIRDKLLSLGIASRLDAEHAALKALAEAVQLHDYARGLLDEEGVIWKAVRDRTITGQNLKEVRADRKYLDSYRKDFRDVVDLPCQMQVYLDPRALEFVEDLWTPAESVSIDQLTIAAGSVAERRDILIERISKEASDLITVDLTTDDISAVGLKVVRVLAPGMYGNSPTAFPYFGGKRIEAAVKSHHGSSNDWHSILRLEPPPYA